MFEQHAVHKYEVILFWEAQLVIERGWFHIPALTSHPLSIPILDLFCNNNIKTQFMREMQFKVLHKKPVTFSYTIRLKETWRACRTIWCRNKGPYESLKGSIREKSGHAALQLSHWAGFLRVPDKHESIRMSQQSELPWFVSNSREANQIFLANTPCSRR